MQNVYDMLPDWLKHEPELEAEAWRVILQCARTPEPITEFEAYIKVLKTIGLNDDEIRHIAGSIYATQDESH